MGYRRTTEGVTVLPLVNVPQAVQNLIGRVLEYPEPFYGVGQQRVLVRQGGWGEDLDEDGIPESFRFEFRQTLVSVGTLTVANQAVADVAHFRNVTTLMVQPSDASFESYTVTSVENTWWAPGIGLVRYDRRADGSDGDPVVSPFRLELIGGVVGGETLFEARPDGVVTKIALLHNDLVYDATRGVYYASVPGSVAGNGNRIAVINANTGAVSYSAAAVGSEPGEMALSADGNALYVGLNGSGEVVKLALPGFAVQWQSRIPVNGNFGYGPRVAQDIAVSPTAVDTIAVATRYPDLFYHGGVFLIEAGVIQPNATADGVFNSFVAFDGDGQFLYSYNAETTGAGLQRMAVLNDGLFEEYSISTDSDFGRESFEWSRGRLALGSRMYLTPDLLPTVSSPSLGGLCVWAHSGARLICVTNPPALSMLGRTLDLVDASSMQVIAQPAYDRGSGPGLLGRIVVGPLGAVALRMKVDQFGREWNAIWLFKSPALE